MSLPSIDPPGLKLKVEMNKGKSFIQIFPTISVANQKVEIHPSSRISFEDFSEVLENKMSLKGNMKLSGNVLLKGTSVQNAVFNLSSRNLSIPPQTINNFSLPLIQLGKLTFKAKIDRRGLLKIESFQAGAQGSPILTTISGSMNINKRFINRSVLNLKGKIKFSSQFYQKDFPILNLLLSGKQKDPQGFFSFTIKGSAMAPQFKIR
jgi:type II secretion system protein N